MDCSSGPKWFSFYLRRILNINKASSITYLKGMGTYTTRNTKYCSTDITV